MNCQEVMELMQRDLDRDLSDSEHEAMTAHLQQCPDCAEMYSRLRQLSQELASLPKVTPPFSLVDSILPQLADIDRQGEGLAATATATAGVAIAPVTVIPAMIERPRRARGAWSVAATGGIVAAGLLLALFITDMDGSYKVADDSKLLYSTAESTASSQAQRNSADAPKSDQQNRLNNEAPASGKPDPADVGSPDGNAMKKFPDSPTAANQNGGSLERKPADEAAKPIDAGTPPGITTNDTPKPEEPADSLPRGGSPDQQITSGGPKEQEEGTAPKTGSVEEPPAAGQVTKPDLTDTDINKGIIGDSKGQDSRTGSITSMHEKDGTYGIAKNNRNPELLSEDGVLIAVLEQTNRRIVVKTADGKQTHMYTSPQWAEREQAQLLKWSGSSRLTYSVTTEAGVTRTVEIDIAKQKETNVQKP